MTKKKKAKQVLPNYFVQDCIFPYLPATAKNFQTILQMTLMRAECHCWVKIKHY